MPITATQIKLIHIAAKQAGLVDAQYRTILRNVGDAESSKFLDQAGYEDCMAVMEDCGFRQVGKPENYWREKVRARGCQASPRMVRKIHALASEGANKYPTVALCLRMSERRALRPEDLTPREAWNLIEGLKAIIARGETGETAEASPAFSADDLPF